MEFQNNIPFIKPPRKFRGMLIIEQDDGYMSALDYWAPLLKSKKQISQWYPFIHDTPACLVANSGFIGTSGRPTPEDLRTLQSDGWEIMNHGKYHAGLPAYHTTVAPVTGESTISVWIGSSMRTEYQYRLATATGFEIVQPIDIGEADASNNSIITLDKPLIGPFGTTPSLLELTDEALDEEINGSLDLLLSWGLDVKHHVFPYHYWYSRTVNKVKERHLSSRLNNHLLTNATPPPDWYSLSGRLDGTFSEDDIVSLIDTLYDEDSLGIFYGHDFNYGVGSRLDNLVTYAIKKGVRIVTRDQAYNLITNS